MNENIKFLGCLFIGIYCGFFWPIFGWNFVVFTFFCVFMVLAFVILWIWTLADADKKSNPQETTFWFKAIMLMGLVGSFTYALSLRSSRAMRATALTLVSLMGLMLGSLGRSYFDIIRR